MSTFGMEVPPPGLRNSRPHVVPYGIGVRATTTALLILETTLIPVSVGTAHRPVSMGPWPVMSQEM